MLARLTEHYHIKNYLLYCAIFIVYAFQLTALGPFIPYLSSQYHYKQTEYGYLFTCRSAGMVTGALLLKYIQASKRLTNHQSLIIATLGIGIFLNMFAGAANQLTQGLWLGIASIFLSFTEILPNICLLLIIPHQVMESWLLFAHGLFGVGALIGPLFVYFLELGSYNAIATIFFGLIPFLVALPTPQKIQPSEQQRKILKQQSQHRIKQRIVPWQAQLLLGILFFFQLGVESTIGAWISTFSILAGVNTKQTATIYVTIYWTIMTAARFGIAYLPGTSSQKMRKCLQLVIGVSVLMLLLLWVGHAELACYLSVVLFGCVMSPLYALILSMVSQFGYQLAQSQTTNIITCSLFSGAVLVNLCGKLIEWISISMLFVFEIVMAGCMLGLLHFTVKRLSKEQTKQNQVELIDKNIGK